jgi:hypothetical protein
VATSVKFLEISREPERVDRYSRPDSLPRGGGQVDLVQLPLSSEEGGGNAAKLLRACGGCLGARRRRRAWKTAKSPAELSNKR